MHCGNIINHKIAIICITIVAAFFIYKFPAQYSYSVEKNCPDTNIYLSMAQHLRHGQFAETVKGVQRTPLFPPGFSILIALFPTPITLLTTTILSCLLYIIMLCIVYKKAGIYSFLLLVPLPFLVPEHVMAAMSDTAFMFVLSLLLLSTNKYITGCIAGFAYLVRPEGILLGILGINKGYKFYIPWLICVCPYLLWIWITYGEVSISPKARFNAMRAPYLAARVPWKDLHVVQLGYVELLPPEKGAQKYPIKMAQKIIVLESPLKRIPANIHTYWDWCPREPLLLLIGLLYIPILLKKKRWDTVLLVVAILSTALPWLLYFAIGVRALFPAFLASALCLRKTS